MAAKGGDSKQGLVVSLVICVLLILLLGVFTYTGYSGQAQLEADKKKAVAEKTDMQQDRDWNRFQNLLWKAYAGVGLSKEEAEDLASLRGQFDGGSLGQKDTNRVEVEKRLKELEQFAPLGEQTPPFRWDAAQKQPATSMKTYIENLAANFTAKQKELAAAQTAAKELEEGLNSQLAGAKKEMESLRNALAQAKQEATRDLSKFVEQVNSHQELIDKLGEKLKEAQEQGDKEKAALQQQIAALNKQIEGLAKNVEEKTLRLETLTRTDVLATDKPKGRVVSIGPDGNPVIDLGSADYVKPGLTFNVFAPGPGGRPQPERKGTVEVVNVLSEHRSQVRVTGLRDPGRDPIVRGDLLFNAAWDPTDKQRVAIAGVVDLDGRGGLTTNPEAQMRQLRDFMRVLEKHNVVVDAYLDLKDLQIKGQITPQTDFLILAAIPEDRSSGIFKEVDPVDDRNKKIADGIVALQKQAQANSVSSIRLEKFVAAMGQPVPGSVPTDNGEGQIRIRRDYSGRSYTR